MIVGLFLTWTMMQVLPAVLEIHHVDHSCILSVKLWYVMFWYGCQNTWESCASFVDLIRCCVWLPQQLYRRHRWSNKSLPSLGVDPKFQDIRVAKRSVIYVILTSWLKTRLTNAEQRFRTTVFNCVIDMVTSQLTQRFTAMNNIAVKFSVIFPSVLSPVPEHDIVRQNIDAVVTLQRQYLDWWQARALM